MGCYGDTNPNDLQILNDFRKRLKNPEVLKWPENGNDPCGPPSWPYVFCSGGRITQIQTKNLGLKGSLPPNFNQLTELQNLGLQRNNLSGALPSPIDVIASMTFLNQVWLHGNQFTGAIPQNIGNLTSLKELNLNSNQLVGLIPDSLSNMDLQILVLNNNMFMGPVPNPSLAKLDSLLEIRLAGNDITGNVPSNFTDLNFLRLLDLSDNNVEPPMPYFRGNVKVVIEGNPLLVNQPLNPQPNVFKRFKTVAIVAGAAIFTLVALMIASLFIYSTTGSSSSKTGISSLTNNKNELGRGGFGTVYKGEIEHTTKIAVKRMECGAPSSRALDEFQAEIAVLSKVRHRHLVSLLGYCIEGNERLLVYEYMPLGALSRHLFHWKNLKLEPLSLSQRFTIALDVARAMEYLHNLARQTFIHRDLKSSNILLGDDFRAKVSDFGLVKLAPDGDKSVATKLAGTFGYLAPEYAVMGKITTKVDVFSYGVVLVELLTGLMALDESRPEESRYLVEWFWQIKSCKEALKAAIDPTLEVSEETFESISIVAELAGHCTSREASHRPDMSHVVNVLSTLVEKWRPMDEEPDYNSGIDFSHPLPQLLKVWKESEGKDSSYASEHSEGSIPAKPSGFADSFTSSDAR
uniref:Receptor protein kinase TMK1 n=1 Tax=Cajanus cajan TaxID=3821 RepID=A0A151TNP2_CAJCA|nr:putative receptor protein kinase TMK1 [Cajanus cajan]